MHGWKEAGVLPANIIVSDPSIGALDQIKAEFPEVRVLQDGNSLAAGQMMDLVPVRPLGEDEPRYRRCTGNACQHSSRN